MIDDLMRTRRSIRRFGPEVPERALIERLLEAAVTAPSASNKQPWRFVVVTRRALIEDMAAAVREAVDRVARHIEPGAEAAFRAYGDYFTRFEKAPVVIVALFRTLTVLSMLIAETLPGEDRSAIATMEERSGLIGTSMAVQNLMLMAHELGLGTSGMTGPLIASARIRELLDLPAAWEIAALIPVGVPAEAPAPTDRKPIHRVTEWIE